MIRWITDSLGTAPASSDAIGANEVSLDVRDLVDKRGNSPAVVRGKIDRGIALMREGKRVVICCDYGISRSNAIAAGILSCLNGITLEEAVRKVMQATGEQEIKLELLRAVRAALLGETPLPVDDPRVLVTGGSGFIGQVLISQLRNTCYVVAPSRAQMDLLQGPLTLDLLVKEHKINRIVHLANPRIYLSNRASGEMLALLRNVLDVCRENDVGLIFPSGWEVYSGYRASEIIADESLPLYPRGPYGEAKLLCETLIEHHRKLHGLKVVILRSSPVYGETGDRPKFIYTFIRKAKENLPIQTHQYLNGFPRLDLLYVDDFVSAVLATIQTRFSGVLNIGHGTALSTREVAEMVKRKTASTSEIASQLIDDFVANVVMDTLLAKQVLGWSPVVPFPVGLERLLQGPSGELPR